MNGLKICNTKDCTALPSNCADEPDSELNNLLDEWDGDVTEIIEEELVAPSKLAAEKSIPTAPSTLVSCKDYEFPVKEDIKYVLRRKLLQSVSQKSDMKCAEMVKEKPKESEATTKQQPHRFYVVSDNLDIRNKSRDTTRTHKNQDHHLFHIVAIRRRMPETHLVSPVQSKSHANSMPPVITFLPAENDNARLKSEFKVHVRRVLSCLVKDLDWMQKQASVKHRLTE